MEKLAERGVKAVSLSASQPELSEPLAKLRDLAAAYGMELVWDLPVPYSALNPVWLEVQAHDPSAIGKGLCSTSSRMATCCPPRAITACWGTCCGIRGISLEAEVATTGTALPPTGPGLSPTR